MKSRNVRPAIVTVILTALVLAASPRVGAADIIDQFMQDASGTSFDCGNPPATGSLWQSFVPQRSPVTAIHIFLRAGGAFHSGISPSTVRLHAGAPKGPVIGEVTTTLYGDPGQSIWCEFRFPQAVCVVPGDTYFIEWVSPGGLIASWLAQSGDPYPDGTFYGCNATPVSGWDLAFRTYVDPAFRDLTPPTLHVATSPAVLWPPNGNLVTVHVAIDARDDACGPVTVALVAVTASSPPGSRGEDIVGADLGTPDTLVQLRARMGDRGGPLVYTLTYEARDAAGNTARDSAVVTVGGETSGRSGGAPWRPRIFDFQPVAVGRAAAIRLAVSGQHPAHVSCIDISGRVVGALELGVLSEGAHDVTLPWIAHLPAGVYWLRLREGPVSAQARMIVLP
jgi:hypothetical protein